MGVAYRWKGQQDPGGGWVERFGAPDALPTRDLTDEDVAGLNDEQRTKLDSPAGQRLYVKVEHAKHEPAKEPTSKKAKPDAGSDGTQA